MIRLLALRALSNRLLRRAIILDCVLLVAYVYILLFFSLTKLLTMGEDALVTDIWIWAPILALVAAASGFPFLSVI
jgi:hypothetical protein